jgi:hypothetical protein
MRGNPEGIVFVGAHGRAPLAETEQSRSRIFFRKHESALPMADGKIGKAIELGWMLTSHRKYRAICWAKASPQN